MNSNYKIFRTVFLFSVFLVSIFYGCNIPKNEGRYYNDLSESEKKSIDQEFDASMARASYPEGRYYFSILDIMPRSGTWNLQQRSEIDSMIQYFGNYYVDFEGGRAFNRGLSYFNIEFVPKQKDDKTDCLIYLDLYSDNPRTGPATVEFGDHIHIQRFKVISYDTKLKEYTLVSTIDYLGMYMNGDAGDSKLIKTDSYIILYFANIKFLLSKRGLPNLEIK